MSKVIALLNKKGGAGKTTVATNLTYAFTQMFEGVLLVDTDPQRSAAGVFHEAGGGNIIQCVTISKNPLSRYGTTLSKDILRLKEHYPYIIIDGAPSSDELAGAAIAVSDLVLIPVQPSPYDVEATGDLVDLVKQRREITGNIQPYAAFIINRMHKHSLLSREVEDSIKEYELPTLNSKLTSYVAYPTTAKSGVGVMAEKGPAATEFSALVEEVLSLIINLPKN